VPAADEASRPQHAGFIISMSAVPPTSGARRPVEQRQRFFQRSGSAQLEWTQTLLLGGILDARLGAPKGTGCFERNGPRSHCLNRGSASRLRGGALIRDKLGTTKISNASCRQVPRGAFALAALGVRVLLVGWLCLFPSFSCRAAW